MKFSSRSTLALWMATALCTTGCVYIVGTPKWFKETDDGKALAPRASFDLSCPANQLRFTPMDEDGGYKTTGVTGCGKKATYLFRTAVGVQPAWILNSEIAKAE